MFTVPMVPEIKPSEELCKSFTVWYFSFLKHSINAFQKGVPLLYVGPVMADAANILALPNFKRDILNASNELWKPVPDLIRIWYEMKNEPRELLSTKISESSTILLFINGKIEHWISKQSTWTKVLND